MTRSLRRGAIVWLTMASFLAGMVPRSVRAQSEDRAVPPDAVDIAPAPAPIDAKLDTRAANLANANALASMTVPPSAPSAGATVAKDHPISQKELGSIATAPVPDSVPAGVENTGVSSQVLSLPQGAGKIDGMGESFSNQLSTGTATYSIPIALPGARGAADPSLALSYSTSGGHGVAGLGWEIGVPYVARQTDRGNPLYQDPPAGAAWTPTQDRFVFNGGQELVPICLVSGTTCTGALTGEAMPSWASGWQYFRPRIEGSFLRVFWSPDHRTWRVQDKNGLSMELGAPLDGSSASGDLETDPANPSTIFRWNLSRQYDAYGAANPAAGATPLPVNVVRYAYLVDGGMSYLSDVYDTPPAAASASAPVTAYAHHVHLAYGARTDPSTSYRRGWQTESTLRLTGIDVTSAPFASSGGATRKLVRRYHLAYDAGYHVSLLTSVQVEGRCGAIGAGESGEPIAEDASGLLPAATGCPTLPAMTFGYTHVTPFTTAGSPGAADLPGYEGFDERVITMGASPPHSVDEANADLFDINSDGLPDVLVTLPGLYGGQDGLYLNGITGQANAFSAGTMGVQGVLGDSTTTITLDNPNISAGDIDGDGVIDLVNMPLVKTYSVYTPFGAGTSWTWQGRSVTTASAQSAKINLGSDGLNIQRMDVNGDGLVDVVLSQGTEMETFLSLDRYPGGDGQFGHATWTSPTTAAISNDPIAACVPWDGLPIQLSDPTVKVADMNGDGLPDLVRVEQGNVHYWPGRGNGYWGTGSLATCPGGTFGESQYVAMAAPPEFASPDTAAVRVDDVNGDGLDDLVVVNFTTVEVYLNVDGVEWTSAHVISNAPASPAYVNRVRIVDVNGSGTRDILWGDGGEYRFMDLSGGARPWMLNHVANGLGKTTDIDYASSTSLMLAAAAAGTPWSSVAPSPIEVVTQMTVSDNLSVAGNAPGVYITQYSYANPVYDGRQREFRGFTTATETRLGDTNSPTSIAQSTFLLGQCQDDEPLNALPSACTPLGRWRDNVREALKGLPTVVQSYAASGTYLSTVHHTYRLRLLYTGADGREVRHAFESSTDTYLYDGASGMGSPTTVITSDVELELTPPGFSSSEEVSAGTSSSVVAQQPEMMLLQGSAGRAHLQSASHVDVFGNTFQSIDSGCVDGCASVDPVITTYAQPAEVSGNTGWLWRTVDTYVSGSTDVPAGVSRNHTQQTFDAAGSPLTTSKVLVGTVALARSNAGTGGVAPAPAQASKDGTSVVMTLTYDSMGNPLTSVAPNSRCRSTAYDPTFDALPTSDTVLAGAVSGACGTESLVTTASYDRGLGAITTFTDIRGETTNIAFDGFGRISATYRPDPDTGIAGTTASSSVEYFLPSDPQTTPYSLVHTLTEDGTYISDAQYHETWAYVDGLGRAIVSLDEADPTGGNDAAPWVASGLTTYDGKGAAKRKYLAFFYPGDPTAFLSGPSTVSSAYAQQSYDAFGRPLFSYALDGTISLSNVYHALSVDAWDAADLTPTSGHYGTFATSLKDGHGRAVAVTERVNSATTPQAYQTSTAYLSTGEPLLITRANLGTKVASVARWIRYDSLGRMVANVEPDTTVAFTASPSAAIPALTWRYAYNDDGDLVGTSDARGCGVNYLYDGAGRVYGENYSPCTAAQGAYTAASEVTYTYDVEPAAATAGIDDFSVTATWYKGRLASTTDRAGTMIPSYDGRGRVASTARQVAGPGATPEQSWFLTADTFDAADRVVGEGVEAGGLSSAYTSTFFSARGLVESVTTNPSGIEYDRPVTVIASITHDADGKPLQIVYGDVAATTSVMSYDMRRRLSSVQTYRGPPALWTAPPATYTPPPSYDGPPDTFQLLLQDLDYKYDVVDDPTEIDDNRIPTEWPAGAQPVSRAMQYDDLYRLAHVAYKYPSATDPWTSPFAAEDQGIDSYAERQIPAPHVSFATRTNAQTFAYDWLGNTTATGDDAGGFYDRSLGAIANGTATAGPYQLLSAKSTGGTSAGSLTTAYDAAGNMTGLSVTRAGACLPAGAVCSQQYAYAWDEVGRLVRARRWDVATPGKAGTVPTTTPAADLSYHYDADDDRIIKAATDATGNVVYTIYAADMLELRGSTWNSQTDHYAQSGLVTAPSLAPYIVSQGVRLGRIVFSSGMPDSNESTLLELPDYLGSTSVTIDHDTSELVEATTYQPFGGTESDYRPARWNSFREDYRFTGKEEDVQVGLEYFGKRYLSAALNRWVSADPLAVHTLQADLNAYAYVHGRPFEATDPTGLEDAPSGSSSNPVATNEAPTASNGQAVNVSAGQVFTYLPGSGVKTFDSTQAAVDSGAKWFYRYDPNATTNWAGAEDKQAINKMVAGLRGALEAGPGADQTWLDTAEQAAHPLSTGSSEGASGGVEWGTGSASSGGSPLIQALDVAMQAWQSANLVKAGIAGVASIVDTVALRQAADKLLASESRDLMTATGAREIGILRDAAKGSGNFGLGEADSATAKRLGEAWVGNGAKVARDGKTMISSDGLRQFRPPSFKPFRGTFQANFEQRFAPLGRWNSNGHLDILFGPEEAP